MRKLLSLLAVVLLISTLAVAQVKSVTGTVTDESGNAVPFATVLIKGQKVGVTADAEGKFTIKVKEGDVLVVSAQGLSNKEVPVGASNVVGVSLAKSSASTLEEVVVTGAFGVKKAQRTTAFSNQVISSENLNIVRQTNVNNALSGKVAGVQARGQSAAKLNSEAFLRIRGGLGIGDRAPVYVVDGTITGSFDINPDDIEDITVLKGANATALFGSLATGGVIVINTKKKAARAGIGLEINSGITIDKVYILPRYQNLYAGGSLPDLAKFTWVDGMPSEWQALDGKYYHDYTDDASWGPRMSGQEYIPWYAWYPGHDKYLQTAKLVPQPDNARDFWETGITTTNNISFGKSGQGYNFRVSYTNQWIKGIIPNSSSMRNTLFTTGSIDLNNHFTVDVNFTYSGNTIKGEFVDGYANQSSGSFNQWFHRDLDVALMKDLKDIKSPYGTLGTWNIRYNPNGFNPDNPSNWYKANYWYNYYSYFQNQPQARDRNRIYGNASLTYKLNNSFRVRGTVRKNSLTTNNEFITRSILEESALQTGVLASYSNSWQNLQENNYELIGFYNQQFGDFGISATAGGNIYTRTYQDLLMATQQGLKIPDLYAISNSKAEPSLTDVTGLSGPSRQEQQVNSVFGSADFEFRKLASITGSIRKDWGSTLSPSKPSLLYPSAGASLVFSELLGNNRPSWFSFGKLFGSWGKKPEALNIYQTNFTYGVAQYTWGDNFLMSTPNTYPNPELEGSLITTVEAGIDLRFARNRIGLNVVYFDETADKIPVNIAISGVAGFTATSVNAAIVERRGIETVLSGKVISNKNLNWDVSATFAYLIANPVTELVEGQDQILLEGGAFGTRFARSFLVKGEDWGQLVGGGIARNDAGQPIVDPNTGLYVADANKKWGSIVPKVTGGLVSNLSWKNFDFGFSLDYQVGGKFFSLSEMWGHFSGLFARTAALNDNGKNVRDDVADGGGVHVVGVSSVDEKTIVDNYIDAQTYFHSFYDNRIAEPYVHDLSFVKLREVSIGYRIPVKSIGNLGKYIQGANFSVIARNPWLIWADAENFDPSEVVNTYGEDGQFPGVRGLGVNLKLNF